MTPVTALAEAFASGTVHHFPLPFYSIYSPAPFRYGRRTGWLKTCFMKSFLMTILLGIGLYPLSAQLILLPSYGFENPDCPSNCQLPNGQLDCVDGWHEDFVTNGLSPLVRDFCTNNEACVNSHSLRLLFDSGGQRITVKADNPLLTANNLVGMPMILSLEARNELSLGYVNNCHAILFVMRASQPCTLGERRYLENFIKDRGLSVFFLVNAWDQVKEALIDPDDEEELREAEERLHKVFKANLAEYCVVDGHDIYDERVFAISSIQALRKRLKNPNADLAGTGFTEFMEALNIFLTRESAVAELRQVRTLARQACHHTKEAIERRIPLLEQDVNQLREKIDSVEPEFEKLKGIGDEFQQEIRNTRDNQARSVSDSFRSYVLNLGNTFETDFLRYQPEINLFDFLNAGKREAFNIALQKAFEQYITDKLSAWSLTAEKDITAAFKELSQSAVKYGASYTQVTDSITQKLTGEKVKINSNSTDEEDNSPTWAKWAMGLLSLSRGNLAGFAMAGAGFDWKNILLNYFTVIGVGGIITTVTGIFLGPIGFALLGLGVGVLQADGARKELVKTAKKELVKYLPQVAQEQSVNVYDAVKECFDAYEKEVVQRIQDDITARKSELDNLLKQKESREINRNEELKRFEVLEKDIFAELQIVESAYSSLLAYYG